MSSPAGGGATAASGESEPPAKKKAKPSAAPDGDGRGPAIATQQASLLSFFPSASSSATKKKSQAAESLLTASPQPPDVEGRKPVSRSSEEVATGTAGGEEAGKGGTHGGGTTCDGGPASLDPIVPTMVATPRGVKYRSLFDNHVIVRTPSSSSTTTAAPRSRVAAFDLDGTLMQWSSDSPGFWPSRLEHYEVWNATVVSTLRALHDDGHLVVVFTNQGGIQSAHGGKKAALVRALLDYLEDQVGRPLCAVVSTRSPKKSPQKSFHKPRPDMWTKVLVGGPFRGPAGASGGEGGWSPDLAGSFFVGDSADETDPQGGVDKKFADSVGVKFYTPDEYFGPSSREVRQRTARLDVAAGGAAVPTPPDALAARSALLGGYLDGPILLLLAGVQGSGKSTFCKHLTLFGGDGNHGSDDPRRRWVHLSQDTISNGRPGKREKVEAEARRVLQDGSSVVIDRMHLDPEQRQHFVDLAREEGVPAHVVVLNPPKRVISTRVGNRANHPGGVQGEAGVRLALQSMDRLVMPTYEEDVRLITCASTAFAAVQLALRYSSAVAPNGSGSNRNDARSLLVDRVPLATANWNGKAEDDGTLAFPVMALGTMKMGRRTCAETVEAMVAAGFEAIDTAPTYKNEDKVGDALQNANPKEDIVLIAKVPKRAVQPDDVRSELAMTLKNLKRDSVDLLLLHWPSDVMGAVTLQDVWKCMESCCKEGKCRALGVCNFNQAALSELLRFCSIPPVVNQVERHPLLSQMDLVDFCARHGITIQAHTPLGQGVDGLLANPVVKQVAKESALSAAQVVVQWNLQHGMCVVPKCSQESHARELLDLVESTKKGAAESSTGILTPDQMKALDGLDSGTRLVLAPFMYGQASYCWGEHMPRK